MLAVDILVKVEQVRFDGKMMVARSRGLRTDIHHRTEDAFFALTAAETRRRNIHTALGQELVRFHLEIRRREANGMAQTLADNHSARQTVRAAEICLSAGDIAVQKRIAHRRRTHAFALVQHDGKHRCRKFGKCLRDGLVVALAASAKAVVVPEKHGTHTALFDEFTAHKNIEREFRDLGGERQHQKLEAEAFDKLALFFGRRKQQRIAGTVEHVIGMRFKGNHRRNKPVHFGNCLERTEKRLVAHVATIKIPHRHRAADRRALDVILQILFVFRTHSNNLKLAVTRQIHIRHDPARLVLTQT